MAASGRTRSLTEALWWAALPGSILFCFLQVTEHVAKGAIGFDSHAYWLAARMPESWYLLAPRLKDAYLYSPAFAELLWPLGQLPWPVFQGLWAAFGAVLLFWLLKPLGWRKGLTLAPFFVTELMLGNVYILFAAALVVGLTRFPGAFAIFAITKLSPSVVFLWFVVRREWTKAAIAAGTTVAIVLVSAAINPQAWVDWVRFLLTSTGEGSVGARFGRCSASWSWSGRRARTEPGCWRPPSCWPVRCSVGGVRSPCWLQCLASSSRSHSHLGIRVMCARLL